MINYTPMLEIIANDILKESCPKEGNACKPNYTNRTFMNCLIIFHTALLDKMYDNQDYDNMEIADRYKMASQSRIDLAKLIHTYTNLNVNNIDDFL